MFNKKTIRDYNIDNKVVLLRADYNVPLDKNGVITSDYRISQSIPTIKALQEKNCKIVICSHLGRPKNQNDKQFSLKPVAKKLSKILNQNVLFAPDCLSKDIPITVQGMKPGEILLLENLRFYEEEEANDKEFAENLISNSKAEVFVQDGFGVVHRAHASTDSVAKIIPSVAGLLLEKEVDTITDIMENPNRPFMAIVGGAKISDKIDIINKFIEKADIIAVGGAMANTFLMSNGLNVGESLVDRNELDMAQDIMQKARAESKKRKFIFYLPQDGVVASKIDKTAKTRIVDWDAHVIAEIEAYPKKPSRNTETIKDHEQILDIGPFSGAFIAGASQLVETVVWNGTMGVTETQAIKGPIGPFAHGTETVIEALVGQYGNRPFSVIGGGDTAGYIESRGMSDMFNHVSTGGGASLELMSGKTLPGVEALWDK
jgi:phosphoglycerate kinase